jgi:hypothetical protein
MRRVSGQSVAEKIHRHSAVAAHPTRLDYTRYAADAREDHRGGGGGAGPRAPGTPGHQV